MASSAKREDLSIPAHFSQNLEGERRLIQEKMNEGADLMTRAATLKSNRTSIEIAALTRAQNLLLVCHDLGAELLDLNEWLSAADKTTALYSSVASFYKNIFYDELIEPPTWKNGIGNEKIKERRGIYFTKVDTLALRCVNELLTQEKVVDFIPWLIKALLELKIKFNSTMDALLEFEAFDLAANVLYLRWETKLSDKIEAFLANTDPKKGNMLGSIKAISKTLELYTKKFILLGVMLKEPTEGHFNALDSYLKESLGYKPGLFGKVPEDILVLNAVWQARKENLNFSHYEFK